MVKRFSVTLDPGPIKGVYTTWSTVLGSLTVEVDKPKYYEKITVHLSGQGRVYWSSAGRNSIEKKESEDYINLQQVVWKKEHSHNGTLQAGTHIFPFQFGIPFCCPSSYHSRVASISYNIIGVIAKRQDKSGHTVKHPFEVIEVVSTDPSSSHATRVEKRKTVGFEPLKSGVINYSVQLASTSYTVGEEIPVSWYVENGSGRQVSLRCSLIEKTKYFVQGECHICTSTIISQTGTTISPHTASEDNINVPVPLCRPAMTRSKIISSEFLLAATVVIPCASDSHIEIPVKVGNQSFLQKEHTTL